MNKDELWFILLNISNKNKILLIDKYKSESIIRRYKNNILELSKLDNNLYIDEKIERFYKYINDNSISYITFSSSKYPKILKEDTNPPYVLFYKGNINLLDKRLCAVIGARRCTQYGVEVSKKIAKELSENDISVVSGMAAGIDSVAQSIALDFKGSSIGILGCGIDVIYPKSNKLLYEKIIEKGLLISEFLPKTPPLKYNFPRRNRIISGLSEKLVIIEASKKSGSLITVDIALSLGKEIMAVPGSVLNGTSQGCNKLIRDGATPFTEIDDLYNFFNINKQKIQKIQNDVNKAHLLKVIDDEPKHLDYIMQSVNVDRKVLFELLFEMQNRNEIICLPGNYYAKSL